MSGAEEKVIRMTTQPVDKLILHLAVPTIISMLVTSFYNLADTFFVRQLENDSMVAAVGVVLPLMTLIQAIGFYHGHGAVLQRRDLHIQGQRSHAQKLGARGYGQDQIPGL